MQIDIDGRRLSLRYLMEVNLVGGSAETLRVLLPLLKPRPNTAWRDEIARHVKHWWEALEARAMSEAKPI